MENHLAQITEDILALRQMIGVVDIASFLAMADRNEKRERSQQKKTKRFATK